MIEFVKLFFVNTITFNSIFGFILYWIPLVFCMVGYSIRTGKNYRKDVKDRGDSSKSYCPTDTIGDLIGRALVSIIPIANLWAAMFNLAPDFFGELFEYIGKVFDQPLVPRKKVK
jgi:hypothetical protein